MTHAKDAPTAADVLVSTPQPDDAGAETADRYEWQAMMAAADVLSKYLQALDEHGNLVEETAFILICELHEDWAVVAGPDSEIISGKHREASVGPFSTYLQTSTVAECFTSTSVGRPYVGRRHVGWLRPLD